MTLKKSRRNLPTCPPYSRTCRLAYSNQCSSNSNSSLLQTSISGSSPTQSSRMTWPKWRARLVNLQKTCTKWRARLQKTSTKLRESKVNWQKKCRRWLKTKTKWKQSKMNRPKTRKSSLQTWWQSSKRWWLNYSETKLTLLKLISSDDWLSVLGRPR